MAWQSWQSGGKRRRLFQLILVFQQLQRILELLVAILVVHHLLVLKDRQHFVQPLAPQRLLSYACTANWRSLEHKIANWALEVGQW